MAVAYSTEVANSIRLSCLLINEGTKCFTQCFLEEVKKMQKGNLHAVLNDPNIKQKMTDYKSKSPKLLTDVQFSLLYPKKGKVQIDAFDLTLVCQLFSTLCNIQYIKTCTESDLSLAADICRIRNARNILYGHIVKIEMTNSEFKKEWTNISKILRRLGTSQGDIDKWKNESLSPQDCENVRQEMFALMASDLSDIHDLARSLLDAVDKQKEQVIYQGEMNEEMKSLINNIKELCVTDAYDDLLLKIQYALDNLQTELVHIITKSVHEPWSTTQSQLKEYSKQMLQQPQMQQDMLEKLDGIKKDTERLLCDSQTVEEIDNYKQFTKILDQSNDAYKILIMNGPSDRNDKQSLKLLAKALGSVPWDIIIDLDYESRTEDGLHVELTKVYELKKDYISSTYKDFKIVTKEDRIRIMKGECGLYILANGCKDTGCPPCDTKFGKAIINITQIMDDIFGRFHSVKPLLFFLLVLNDSCESVECFNRLLYMAKDLVDNYDTLIDLDHSNIMLYSSQSNIKIPVIEKPFFCKISKTDGTVKQISHLLQKSFSSENEIQYFFPGLKGMCSYSNGDIVKMKGILELYHTNIGKLDVSNMNAEDVAERFCNIKFSFLKGNELTPTGLYINDKDQVYVVRHEMKELLDIVKEELESRKTWNANTGRNSFILEHDPSGGGTTCIRYILYSLREQYPCAIISYISDKTFEWIRQIYDQSRLPILLVLDNPELNKSDPEILQHQLTDMNIKALVVHIKFKEYSGTVEKKNHTDSKQGYFYIPSTICYSDDQAAFNKLYQLNREKMELHKVFLYGLLAFCEEYERLHQHLSQCIQNASHEEKIIVQIVCLVWRYSHKPTKSTIINRILEKIYDRKENSKHRYLKNLGSISDLLVVHDKEFRPAHNCIIDPSLEKIIGSDKGDQLQAFARLMLHLVEDDSKGIKHSTNILYCILYERSENSAWSPFLVDLETHCGQEFVLSFLMELDSLNDNHRTKYLGYYQMLQARYLMYKIDNPEQAVYMMRKALQLKPEQSVINSDICESTLLNTYGHLLKLRRKKIYDFLNKDNDSFNKAEFLKNAEHDTKEAVEAFQKAKKYEKSAHITFMDPVSFIGEAQVRASLLNFHFELLCNSDPQRFADYLKNCDSTFIKESEKKGMQAIDDFEFYDSNGRFKKDNYEKTLENVRLVKFEFLRLKFKKGTSVDTLIHSLSSQDILYDVGNLVRSHNRRRLDEKSFSTNSLRAWSELTLEELQLIIKTIDTKIHVENMKLLRCNYRDIILAMIYVRHLTIGEETEEKLKKYDISYARDCANLWTKKYPEDQNAHFMLAVLLLVMGLKQSESLLIQTALDHFERSRKNGLKSKHALNFKKKRFAIGVGDGLEAVVPIYMYQNKSCELAEFSGRQIGKSKVNVRPFEVLHATIEQPSDNIKTSSHQQKSLNFNLVISHSNIFAQTIEDHILSDEMDDLV